MRRPLSGALLGIVLGLAVAVILQQHGIWPLDKITVFLLPAATGLVGILITSIGRAGSTGTLTVALVITIPMAAWGATGLTDINQVGQLDGPCDVFSASSVPDSTVVTDTARNSPFLVDPEGSLEWAATSDGPITDHIWEIWVEIGGIAVPIEEGGDPNEGLSTGNFGDVPNVTEYAESRGIPLDQLRGVFMVGGFILGTGGNCEGFGFVKLISDPFETLISQIALALAILALIALMMVTFMGRGGAGAGPGGGGDGGGVSDSGGPGVGGAAAGAGSGGGRDDEDGPFPGDLDGDGDIDLGDYTGGTADPDKG